MTILLFGRSGQIGWELQRALRTLGPVVALGRRDADFTREEQLRETIRAHRPSFIVNAAAYTAVDQAESEAELAYSVNARAVQVIAEEAAALNSWLVHYSTDYVFDGDKAEPYNELDAVRPLSVYGKTKLAGEDAVRAVGGRHLIFRCSWIYASRRSNFPLSILKLALERDHIRVIDDCFGAPTGAPLVADVTAFALRRIMDGGLNVDVSGDYHLATAGSTTWHDYASFLVEGARRLGMPVRLDVANIGRISERDYGAPARRPLNSRFDTSKLRQTFGIDLMNWQIGIERFLQEIGTPLTLFSTFYNSQAPNRGEPPMTPSASATGRPS
jgi:dTDP-4-dehydrorhamnose reductase